MKNNAKMAANGEHSQKPQSNRLFSLDYDNELYKKCNEVERLFRMLKGFRRISSRFDKLDSSFIAFIYRALIFIAIR